MRSSIIALAGSISTALAAARGWNYGSQGNTLETFEASFRTAQGLQGTSGWNSARLYTMIQDGSANTVISAIPAAIATKTTLLLGVWASEDQAAFNNEITALKNAISQYGQSFADLVVGISVGSEDLYRISPTGIAANSGYGQSPDVIVNYIGQVRAAISGTVLANIPVGHVDTWNSYTNSSNAAVIAAVDFLGLDEYPYYENTNVNSVSNASNLFFGAYDRVSAVAQGKPIWITETGWPTVGPTENLAVANTQNAEAYWKSVACELLNRNIPVWWYILNDAGSNPSFGVETAGTQPLYDLSCPNVATSSSAAPTTSVASATMPSDAASTTIRVSNPVPTGGIPSSSADLSSVASSVASVTPSVSSEVSSVSSAAVSSAKVSSAPASSAAASSAAGSAATSVASDQTTTMVKPVTTEAATSVAQNGETVTVYSTTLVTITSCGTAVSSCPTSGLSTAVSASESSVLASAASSVTSAAGSAVVPSGAPSVSGCPADINGAYQYPHLIVPVDSANPDKAYGTQYNGTVSPKISTIFNFDIPASYEGKTCSTVFLFPQLDQLETSSYEFNDMGGFTIALLNGVANEKTTYANAPAVAKQVGQIDSLKRGSSHVLSMDKCPAGARVSFEVTSTNGLDLEFFQDYNPSPLGLYVRAC